LNFNGKKPGICPESLELQARFVVASIRRQRAARLLSFLYGPRTLLIWRSTVMANEGGNNSGGSSGGRSNRGFAAMDAAKQREIASKGGSASGGNFANDPERARQAGRKGGEVSGGNFANDPQRASEAGRKGGEASRGGRNRNKNTGVSDSGGNAGGGDR
jgi:general stress protein YciG